MEVIPAVDIRGGRCVRLHQGDYDRETVYGDDPAAAAARWVAQGARRVHVVDLDGARERRPVNAAATRAIVRGSGAAVQAGGGVRDLAALRATLELGAARVVLGTAALDPGLLREAVGVAGERLVVSVDARDGVVRTEGWTASSGVAAADFVRELERAGVARIVYTDIARDGVAGSPNFEACEAIAASTPLAVIAAGGVSALGDLRRLARCGVEAAIVGRALYSGDIRLPEAIEAAAGPGGDEDGAAVAC